MRNDERFGQRLDEIAQKAMSMCPSCLGTKDKPNVWDEQTANGTIKVRCGHRFHGKYAG